jgi:hypothetical protein
MVNMAVTVAAVPLALSVNLLLPVAGFGLKDAVTPLGNGEVLRLTLPLNAFTGFTVIVVLLAAPP